MGVIEVGDRPLPGPRIPERPLSFWAAQRAGGQSWINAVPIAAYVEPDYMQPSLVGPLRILTDPEGLKHVLIDNPGNWPKAELQRRFTAMIFGNGILLSEGATWRAHRKLMAPAFDPRAVSQLAPMMIVAAEACQAGWREKSGAFDFTEEMSALTLTIISRAMFSTDSERLMRLVADAVPRALALRPGLGDVLPGLGGWMIARRERLTGKIFAAMDAAIFEMIAARSVQGADAPNDLLTRLIKARDENGEGLTPREIRDEVVTIYVAGHETTSVAMTWVWCLLALRPEIEARLHEELATVLGGRAPTAEDLPKLVYTRAVIDETMRLYPPAGMFGRQAVKDEVVAGRMMKAGSMIMISPWILHRHRRLWDDPETFDPERFLPERAAGRPKFAYLPFGAGPRICIGAQLALMEATVVLATFAQHWRPRLVPRQDIQLRHRATLRPASPMLMSLEPLIPGKD